MITIFHIWKREEMQGHYILIVMRITMQKQIKYFIFVGYHNKYPSMKVKSFSTNIPVPQQYYYHNYIIQEKHIFFLMLLSIRVHLYHQVIETSFKYTTVWFGNTSQKWRDDWEPLPKRMISFFKSHTSFLYYVE